MTYFATHLNSINGIGYTNNVGPFETAAEAIEAAMLEQDKMPGAEWIMVDDEDGNLVADCTRDQLDAIRQGYQNPVDLARFHVEGPDFYKAAL